MSTSYFSRDYQENPDGASAEVSGLVIRVAQPGDLTELVEVLSNSFYPQKGIGRWFFPILRMGMYEDLRQRLKSTSSGDYVCLVAISSPGQSYASIVGTVEVALRSNYPLPIRSSFYPYLSNLAVQREYRRQGVAQRLLRTCEEIVVERGFHDLYLHVLEDNHSAKRLYLKAGYEQKQADPLWCSWLLKQPRRVLLNKQLLRR